VSRCHTSFRVRFLTTVAVWAFFAAAAGQSVASGENFQGVRQVKFHGYEEAVELSNSRHRVILCPEVGGRVLEYSHDGNNVLYLSDEELQWKQGDRPASSAGRFDIGPELIIPERQVLWQGAWSIRITGPRSVQLTSPDCASAGVRLVRDFQLDESSSRLLCTQTIVNISDKVTEWCHWSRTFAVGHGICVIPETPNSRFPNGYVLYEEGTVINMKPEDPHILRRKETLMVIDVPRKPKLGFDSSAGVIAYLAPTDLLFVKRFSVDRNRVYNEAAGLTISVWYPDRPMVELEPIGPREVLQPGQSAAFTEEWWLAPLKFPENRKSLDPVSLNEILGTMQVKATEQ